ncbi:MAG: enoyl-CoA hydratase/carnithine racemase [Gammaproteobacteria bacterium]|jgi:enoyl-CoA hydratase/carnithine racemase
MDTAVEITQTDGIAVITINREDAGNSINQEVVETLDDFFAEAQSDPALHAVVITGAGERFFAAGGDVKRYRELRSREQLRAAFARPRRLMGTIEQFPRPVIAAINGWSLGGGSELILACDLRVVAEDAQIGFPYARLSLVAGWHGARRLVSTVGQGAARNLLLRAKPIDAAEALRIGLVHEVAPRGEALTTALRIAEEFRELAPLSAGSTKRMLYAITNGSATHARSVADREFEDLWVSADHREAEAAFEEKRPPVFKGS